MLLLYGDEPDAIERLRTAIATLGPDQGVHLDRLPGFAGVDGCSLLAELGDSDRGVRPIEGSERSFRCVLDAGGWRRVSDLLEPFASGRPPAPGGSFQYLVETGPIEWIVSTTRAW